MIIKDRISNDKKITNRHSVIMGANELKNCEYCFNVYVKMWQVVYLFDGHINTSVRNTKGSGYRTFKTEKDAVYDIERYMNREGKA